MRNVVALIVALGVAVGFAAPAFAKAPTTQTDCEKAKMKWDDSAKKCSKASSGY